MIIARTKKIEQKVFTKKNIRHLWNLIDAEFKISQRSQNHSSLKLKIKCEDGTSYESEMGNLLKDGDIIDRKKCISINIEYRDYDLKRDLTLDIKHGDNGYGNELFIKGDKRWALAKFEDLAGSIESVKLQQHWFVQYKIIILNISAPILGYLFIEIIGLFLNFKPIENPSEAIQMFRDIIHQRPLFFNLIWLLLLWTCGYLPTWKIQDHILKLWPDVEFDFGPEHKKREKMRREKLSFFILIIIAPLVVNLLVKLL